MKTMGRKPLTKGSLRDRKVYLRFTAAEYDRIMQWFGDSPCRTIGEFCYRTIRDARVIAYTRIEVPADTQAELKRIGNNLNQIALALNRRKGQPAADDSFHLLQQISRQLQSLINLKNAEK